MTARLLATFLAVTCLMGAATVSIARAEAPRGFYRFMVGDFAVTALSDGTNTRTVDQLLQLLYGDRDKLRDELLRAYPDGQVAGAVNAYLIDTGSRLVLVDAGNGTMGAATMGKVIDNLRAAGYRPEDVDEIYLTHMHGDHVGGLVTGGERAFPKATVYADKAEAGYWLDEGNMNTAPESTTRTFQAAKTALTPYMAAGKFRSFAGNAQLAPGIMALEAFGHTPGHTAYVVASKGETLLLWGDIIHVAAVQFADPTVTLGFDSDRAAAAHSRLRLMAEAAEKGWLIGGIHLAFPGLGHVKAAGGNGFVFVTE